MLGKAPQDFFGCVCMKEPFPGPARVYKRTAKSDFYWQDMRLEQPGIQDQVVAHRADYVPLRREVVVEPDAYTDEWLTGCEGKYSLKSPGRGQGVGDVPGLKFIGSADASDILQGAVGDCWLMSAICALAEFDGAIRQLFRKIPNADALPLEEFNRYTVVLYDLATWEPVDVVVDERLLWDEETQCLAGCRPSADGELWPCVLEKACVAHCGGWDHIDGGCCTHAWRFLTGCKDVYQIYQSALGNGYAYQCFGVDGSEPLSNSPQNLPGLLETAWPALGGGGAVGDTFDIEALFLKMCAWHAAGYLMSAGREGNNTKNWGGIVDGHAYTLIECIRAAGGTNYDMIKLRNPRGEGGEYAFGDWVDGGTNWQKHPEVFEVCGRPVAADDGIFWMQKEDFFKAYQIILLCAKSMGEFRK